MTPRRRRMSRRTFLGAAGAAGMTAAAGAAAGPASATPDPAGGPAPAPVRLTVDGATTPLGIDSAAPRLAWQLPGDRRGVRQRAYQVRVATSAGRLAGGGRPDVWDSGRVASAESVDVPYGGPALDARRRYLWNVRVWDERGVPSEWSEPSWWEMGLLAPADWSARWIGADTSDALTFDGASWIWYPEGDPTSALPPMTRYFRAPVDLPAGAAVTRARMLITADDSFVLHVNGTQLGATPAGALWYDGQAYDVTSALSAGHNTWAVTAVNALDTNGNPSPAGLLAVLVVDLASGDRVVVRTGAGWRASTTAPAGWTGRDFDDSGWAAARALAVYGGGPWGRGATVPPAPAPLLRREFTVRGPVLRARVYAAGAGYHELELNGRKVGDHWMDTAPTDYDARVLYVTHDVTSMLRRGANAIGAELGRGFFGLTTSTAWDWTSAPWHGDPRLALQLEIDYRDGSRDVVGTGTDWQTADGPTRSDSVYAGETYDARFARPGWSAPGYDAGRWTAPAAVDPPKGAVRAQAVDPIRVVETVRPVAVTRSKAGTQVFDLGRTLGGWVELRVSGAAGTRVSLKYAQQLTADGTADLEQGYVHGGRFQTDEYVLAGQGTEVWHPRFSHKSFRYVEVDGLPDGGTLAGQEVRTSAPVTGSFSSSSALYDDIHAMVQRSQGHHMLGIPAVDVMYEKIGWTADGQLNVPSLATNFGAHRFYANWLDDLADSQSDGTTHTDDGRICVIAPSGGWGYGTTAPEWTAAYPIVMWELYQRFGDRRALADHYDGVRRYVDWDFARRDGDGLVSSDLGDWLSPGGYTQPPEDTRLTATAYLFRELTIVAGSARVLGRAADAAAYSARAAEVRDAFNAAFLDRGNGLYRTAKDPGYRQTSNAVPVAFGIVPDDLRDRVVSSLVADVRSRGNHLNTGAVGTAVLLPVLSASGHADVACAVAGRQDFPSWGYWLANGADTLWETWELVQNGQGRPPSHDHYLFGSIDQWFYEYVAGITPAAPGYAQIGVRPYADGPLTSAQAEIETVRGRVGVSWHKPREDQLDLTVVVPGNATAEVTLPADTDAVLEGGRPAEGRSDIQRVDARTWRIGSGRYAFTAHRRLTGAD
ncbi:family 78 glycoside hydrolase catalytic domain [Streptomyces sp. NPDC020917]|uniref:family 78 glycoside hydrolase catalytic domain n=1 Tax=Streptomyces sp. NPDC020917 TaxID=3365102 RepID=UPI0037A84EBE